MKPLSQAQRYILNRLQQGDRLRYCSESDHTSAYWIDASPEPKEEPRYMSIDALISRGYVQRVGGKYYDDLQLVIWNVECTEAGLKVIFSTTV